MKLKDCSGCNTKSFSHGVSHVVLTEPMASLVSCPFCSSVLSVRWHFLCCCRTGKICDAVEVSGKNVLSTSSTVTTGLVSHKYCAVLLQQCSAIQHRTHIYKSLKLCCAGTGTKLPLQPTKGWTPPGTPSGRRGPCSRSGRPWTRRASWNPRRWPSPPSRRTSRNSVPSTASSPHHTCRLVAVLILGSWHVHGEEEMFQ